MRLEWLGSVSLACIAACSLSETASELDALGSVEQAVEGGPRMWCVVEAGVPSNLPTPEACEDPTDHGVDKVTGFSARPGSIPPANFEVRWMAPRNLIFQGCEDNNDRCFLRAPSGCGNTEITVSARVRDNRSASNPWITVTAVAKLHLGSNKHCQIAALDPPSCNVALGACAGTWRESWVWVVASLNADDTQRTSVGISYTSGSEWCSWYSMEPGWSEEWMSAVPTYTLMGRVQTQTDWDVSPYCTFYMNAATCGDLDP